MTNSNLKNCENFLCGIENYNSKLKTFCFCTFSFQSLLSGLREFLATENHLEMMKTGFCFPFTS